MRTRNSKLETRNFPPAPRAFTLIELMVAIAIIVILTAIGLTVGNNLVRSNEINRTRTIMANAMQIATEYEVTIGPVPNHLASVETPIDWTNDGGNPPKQFNSPAGLPDAASNKSYDLDDVTGTQQQKEADLWKNSIERFVWATQRVGALKKFYATFRPESLKDTDPVSSGKGYLEILDAWNRKLIYVTYVRIPDNANNASVPDDTSDDFLPKRETYYFASAGPDGKWGHASPDDPSVNIADYKQGSETPAETKSRLREESGDNVYSIDSLEVR